MQNNQENPHIQFAKQELSLLMFRYLKNKYPENELRSESEYYSLMRYKISISKFIKTNYNTKLQTYFPFKS